MDRFVWFVLLVVISHLVTEFTRATNYTRGPRQDVVMVNDVIFNSTYKSTESSSVSWSGIWTLQAEKSTSIPSIRQQQEQQPQAQNANSTVISLASTTNEEVNAGILNFRSIIDNIFEVPISILCAVNNLVGRLTRSLPTQPQQDQQLQQPTKFSFVYSCYPLSCTFPSYYGMQSSVITIQRKREFEMLKRIKEMSEKASTPTTTTKEATKSKSSLCNSSSCGSIGLKR